jgi:diguanylate cyclase (GGDEF)-like protein
MQILIADDEETMRRLLAVALRGMGHTVTEACDGAEAWDLWQREPAAFVITDWNMPRLTGPDLIRRIRAANHPSYTYLILLTSRSGKDDVIAGLEAGADDYLTKPYDPHELRARLNIGVRILDLEARLKDAVAKQADLASHDALTKLLNRRALYEQAEGELARARREDKPVGLVLVDIDHFKAINDARGHLVGDQALRFLADALTQAKRPYDLAGRWGGEEFLLVLPGAKVEDARAVAERLRATLAETSFVAQDSNELSLLISAGVTSTSAVTDSEAPSLSFLLQQADDLLYQAKRSGRNRVCAQGVD